jgi:hypothetical protein
MKIWSMLCAFFGFGEKVRTPQQQYEELELWVNSQGYFDQCQQRAYQAVQKKDSLRPSQIHASEGQIYIDCLKVDSSLSRYQNTLLTNQFGEAKYLAEVLHSGITTQLTDSSMSGVENYINGEVARKSPSVEDLMSKLDQARKELHIFKGAHGLVQEAETPILKNFFYILGAFAIIEMIVNILFLREAFDPIDGFIIAFFVTAINLGFAAWFGTLYREKNHTDTNRAKKGRRNALYATLIVLFANLTIAGFRLIATQQLDSSFILQSVLIFVVGCALGYVSFHKAYRSDDPFPGYGPLSRKVAELEAEFKQVREEHNELCRATKAKALDVHTSLEKRIASSYQQFVNKLPEIRKAIEVWGKQRSTLNQRGHALQRVFKAIILSNTEKELNYPEMIRDLPADEILESFKSEVDTFEKDRKLLDQRVEELQKQIKTSRDELEKWFKSDEANKLFGWPIK